MPACFGNAVAHREELHAFAKCGLVVLLLSEVLLSARSSDMDQAQGSEQYLATEAQAQALADLVIPAHLRQDYAVITGIHPTTTTSKARLKGVKQLQAALEPRDKRSRAGLGRNPFALTAADSTSLPRQKQRRRQRQTKVRDTTAKGRNSKQGGGKIKTLEKQRKEQRTRQNQPKAVYQSYKDRSTQQGVSRVKTSKTNGFSKQQNRQRQERPQRSSMPAKAQYTEAGTTEMDALMEIRRTDHEKHQPRGGRPQMKVVTAEEARARRSEAETLGKVKFAGAIAANGSTADRMLLASHNRILWFDIRLGEVDVLLTGQGRFFAIFPSDTDPSTGKPTAFWVLNRPPNSKDSNGVNDTFVKLSAYNGYQMDKIQVPSKAAQDAVRYGDTIFVASTGDGSILELELPFLRVRRHLNDTFGPDERAVTIAVAENGFLWALTQIDDRSEILEINSTGHTVRSISYPSSHGLKMQLWENFLVVLDSTPGALMLVDTHSGRAAEIFTLKEEGISLKGLTVVGDRAIFGITHTKSAKQREPSDAEIAIFDLVSRELVARRKVSGCSTLNVIASPEQWKASPAKGNLSAAYDSPAVKLLQASNGILKVETRCKGLSPRGCVHNPYCRLARRKSQDYSLTCMTCPAVPCIMSFARQW